MTTAGSGSAAIPAARAGLRRRFISLLYEALILAAILLAGALPPVMLTSSWHHDTARAALQGWLILLCGCFYVWQWRGTGQTLPMKTWRMRLTARDGSPLTTARALARYAAVYVSLTTLGLGYLWALIDPDRQFLHDRLAGTRLIMADT